MRDNLDLQLLDALQRDADRTAEELAREIPLSPSAIARRLRRLKGEGAIARIVAVLAERIAGTRVSALVLVQLDHHAPRQGLDRLRERLSSDGAIQWCAEVSGAFDIALVTDHRSMGDFTAWADLRLAEDPVVRRYETSFVKRAIRFSPMVALAG